VEVRFFAMTYGGHPVSIIVMLWHKKLAR